MTLQELLGEAYKEGMTAEEIGEIISKMKLADLSKGDYVAKGRLTEAENALKSIKKNMASIRLQSRQRKKNRLKPLRLK